MNTLWKVLTRRKVLDPESTQETPLARVLNTFDLTALGVGSTLGVGVYVLAGQVAKNTAGPAVIISFLIAAVASVFAGLCYAEFGARTPRAGSAYIYSYLCVGEFIAFVIGWNLILEYIIGSASVAKGLSSYVDNLFNGTLSRVFLEVAPLHLPYLSPYFDCLAFTVPILLAIALAFGMKESSLVNNVFTTVNVGVVLFVVIAGSFYAHLSNWRINPDNVKNVTDGTNLGKGGFFPFGIEGVVKGAATCFYGFVGFDCIATTGEEVKNPKKAIPIAIISSLFIIFLAYFGTSTVLTLMVPYYEQNPTAPIPYAFQSVHWYSAALVVTFGAMFGLYASLFGAMFPLPRILYAMAADGLIFKCMGQVSERFKTPVIGTLLAGLFTGFMAGVFNLDSLVNMMSIGTLLAYTIVAACVLLLRYSVDEKSSYAPVPGSSDSEDAEGYSDTNDNAPPIDDSDETALTSQEEDMGVMRQIFNCGKAQIPNKTTELIVSIDICSYCLLCFLLGLCILHLKHQIMNREILSIIIVSVILLLMALTILSIVSQPVSKKVLSFQVPWVPLVPALSIFFNIYLMIMLDIATWIRFAVWMIVGVPTFCLTRRNIGKKSSTPISERGYENNGFYDGNLVLKNDSDTFSNQEIIKNVEKKLPPLEFSEDRSNVSKILTPSPSTVIETLDLVIESFVDETVPSVVPVASALNESPVSTRSVNLLGNDFRDTPNTALRTKLLNDLRNVDLGIVAGSSNTDNENYELHNTNNSELVENNSDLLNKHITDPPDELVNNLSDVKTYDDDELNLNRASSSDSENSYVSASSSVAVDQNKVDPPNDLETDNHDIFIPPPPSMEDFNRFTNRKRSVPEFEEASYIQRERPVTLERFQGKKNDPRLIVSSKSLNSVKLRHIGRPSLEEHHKSVHPENSMEIDSSAENLDNPKSSKFVRSMSINADLDNKYNKYNTPTNKNNGKNSNTIPKIGISKDAINSVKLKPTVRPSLSMNKKFESEKPDAVKFGTPEFEVFKNKLNEKLKNPSKIPRAPSFVDSNKTPRKRDTDTTVNEDVIVDPIDIKRARAIMESEVGAKLNVLKVMSVTEASEKKLENDALSSHTGVSADGLCLYGFYGLPNSLADYRQYEILD